MAQCNKGHSLREVARRRVREKIEDVVYKKQLIKKFNREGSEAMVEANMPEFVEREVEVDLVEYHCDECQKTQVIRENQVAQT